MESQLFFLPYKKQRKGSIFPIVIWFKLARCCQKDFCSCQKDFSSSTPQFTQSFGQWDRLLWKFLFVPMGGSHGQRSLAGWGFKKPDTSEQLRAAQQYRWLQLRGCGGTLSGIFEQQQGNPGHSPFSSHFSLLSQHFLKLHRSNKACLLSLHTSESSHNTSLHYVPCCAQSVSCDRLSVTLWTAARQAPLPMGILQARILFQGIFPTQELNLGLPYAGQFFPI